jgi:hypothetical protein
MSHDVVVDAAALWVEAEVAETCFRPAPVVNKQISV